MQGWQPDAAPGFGWPLGERTWVNPKPERANLWMARAYAGTVMLEGTTLSEGRGTTRPLELFGAPDLDAARALATMQRLAPQWLAGCRLRDCWFEPTFHKHVGKLCGGVFRSTSKARFYDHDGVPAVAPAGARVQGAARALSRLSAVARLRLRIRARQARHRRHQRPHCLREWVDVGRAPGDLDALTVPDESRGRKSAGRS